MKKKLIVLLSSFHILLSFGQSIRVSFKTILSNEIKDIFHESYHIGVYEDDLGNKGSVRYFDQYIPRGSKNRVRGVIIQKWDKNGNVILDKKHILSFEKEGIPHVIYIEGNNFYIIESFDNDKDETLDYFLHEFNEGEIKDKRKIFSASRNFSSGKLKYIDDYRYDVDYFGMFSISKNNRFIAFSADLGKDKNDSEKHQIILLDTNFNVLWKREFKHSSKDALFHFSNLEVSDKGEIIVLGKAYNKVVKEKKSGAVNYQFEIFKVSKENEKKIVLNTSNDFVKEFNILLDDSFIQCIGLYAQKPYHIEGALSVRVNIKDFLISNTTKQSLSNVAVIEKYGNLLKREFPDYKVQEVKKLDNGDYIILAEDTAFSYSKFMNSNIGHASYQYGDVLVILLSSKGELKWSRNISKNITGGSLGYYSVSKIIYNDTHVSFLTNAFKELGESYGKKNQLNSGKMLGNNVKNTNLYAVVFDRNNGDFLIQTVQKNKDIGRMFNVSRAKSLDAKSLVLWNSKRKKGQFLTVEIK